MPDIHVLDQNTINQIAAGEVIERPASVVKELLENAIDAKSTAVTVEIKEGGIGFIRITDNGCGIEKKDVKIAFLRHSTSKIMSAEDLVSVSSLGFRGEALSSIAAVGQVELITKTKGDLTGIRYVIEGGEEKSFDEVGVPDGTTFIVRNLFFNTPARRKFLKSTVTEGGYISDIVERIALSHPEVSVRFIVNGQNKLHTSGNGNLKDVIYAVFGREIAANLLEIKAENEFMKISGFVGKPIISRGNRNYENYFINGRYIRSSFISKSIEEAYKPFMMQHKYPFTALHISIDGSLLDVNVHPTKMELRFRNQEQIYPCILKLIGDTLLGKELIPESVCDDEKTEKAKINNELKEQKKLVAYKPLAEPFEVNRRNEQFEKKVESKVDSKPLSDRKTEIFTRPVFSKPEISKTVISKPVIDKQVVSNTNDKSENNISKDDIAKDIKEDNITKNNYSDITEKVETDNNIVKDNNEFADKYKHAENVVETKPEQLTLFEEKLLTKEAREKHVLVGQVFDTYWIVQFGDKMFIIDQHAAHEKVLYERTLAKYKERKAMSQSINPPIILTLSMSEEALLNKYMDIFTDFGYEIEHFGGKEYCVRAVPYDLYSISKEDLLMEILDNLSDETAGKVTPQLITEKIASMSCKAAVKGNNKLSEAEANKLIDELLTLENPYNCPHGRPTIISMSKYELEKKFKRVL
ncbi:MAG: DNA mismatch repair endonuclease MutL [Lachnospiraceae bacterium]|nr:DNA mismatch repair endonuclease MutL [Lachnospiraceae bacterium]